MITLMSVVQKNPIFSLQDVVKLRGQMSKLVKIMFVQISLTDELKKKLGTSVSFDETKCEESN